MAELNRITGIVVGQYGEPIYITIVDDSGTAINISGYTTSKQVTIFNPNSLTTKTYTASFTTTGVDGGLNFTPAAGDIDGAGIWKGQVRLKTASAEALSVLFNMEVVERIAPTT